MNFWLLWVFTATRGLFSSCSKWRSGSTLGCGAQVAGYSDFSCCGTWALGAQASAVVAFGLQSAGSVVEAHRLSCSMAYGIFLDQGSNLCLLHWQAYSLPLSQRFRIGSLKRLTTQNEALRVGPNSIWLMSL